MNVKKLWSAAALSAASFIGGIGLTISSGWLITMAAQQPPILTLSVAIVGVRFFGISRSAFRYAERVMSHSAVFSSLTNVRANIFQKIAYAPITSIRTLIEGSFAKKIVDDVERAQEYQLRDVLPRMSAIISVGIGTALGVWISPISLLFTVPVFIIFLIVIPAIYRLRVLRPSFSVEDSENLLADLFSLSQAEIKEAEIFGYLETLQFERYEKITEILKDEKRLLRRIGNMQLLSILTIGFAVLSSMAVAQTLTSLPSVRITMMIFLPLVIYEAVTAWYPSMFTSAKLIRAQQSIDQIEFQAPESTRSPCVPIGSAVIGHHVQVSWGDGFMKPISFKATPKSPLLVMGANGTGKSTLALGLAGVLPYQGSISVCNCEVSEIDNIEEFIASSLQNSHIFNTSLRENLKIADPLVSDVKMIEILRNLELDNLSLDEFVGEFGRTLSGGEAKRISLARSLLSPAPVIVLDEPLEHLDKERALRIERYILKECKDRTLIVIAHSGWKDLTNTLVLVR